MNGWFFLKRSTTHGNGHFRMRVLLGLLIAVAFSLIALISQYAAVRSGGAVPRGACTSVSLSLVVDPVAVVFSTGVRPCLDGDDKPYIIG